MSWRACKECGKEASFMDNFCTSCGNTTFTDRSTRCSKCKMFILASHKFCSRCGQEVSKPVKWYVKLLHKIGIFV